MSFKGNLFDHQKEAASFLISKKRALLTHEQGLGKTVTALAAFEKLKELKKADRCLIIAEASYLWQWENAIKKFTNSSYTVYNTKETRANYTIDTNSTYHVISYNICRNDFQRLVKVYFPVVITDEAQVFANHKSKTSVLLKKYNVKQKPVYKWALTGTAIRNKLEDLYSIMYWVDKDFLPIWPIFEKKHIIRMQTGITGYKNLESLHTHLKHKVHRRTHKDVEGQIPEIIGPKIHVLPVSTAYREAEEKLLKSLDSVHEDFILQDYISYRTKSSLAKAFNECRQELSGLFKVKYLVSEVQKILEENEKNKIVVFSFYKRPLYLLDKFLFDKGIECVKYTGDETSEGKQESIRKFADRSRVLLVSNAGSRGLDLPYANYVYHVDVPLSYDTLDQRNKRITRLSSLHKSVVLNYLIADESIEKFYFDIVLNQGELLKATFDEAKDKVTIKTQTLRQYLNAYRRDEIEKVLSASHNEKIDREAAC